MSIVHDSTRLPRDLIQTFMALRAAGCPIREIAERIGQSRASTYRWLVRYGIPRRAVTLRRGAQRTHGDRGPWLATPDLLALWKDRKLDIEYIAQHSGSRPSAIRERLITAGALPMPRPGEDYSTGDRAAGRRTRPRTSGGSLLRPSDLSVGA
jgi:hypothetical protein